MAREAEVGGGASPRGARPAGEVQAPSGRRGPFGRAAGFIAESWAELHKVEWPNQKQLIQGTVVVIVACIPLVWYVLGRRSREGEPPGSVEDDGEPPENDEPPENTEPPEPGAS